MISMRLNWRLILLLNAILLVLPIGFSLTDTCSSNLDANITIYSNITPVSKTLPYTINIPLYAETDGSILDLNLTYNDGNFKRTETTNITSYNSKTFRFDVDFDDTIYNATVWTMNSSGSICSFNYQFAINKPDTTPVSRIALLMILPWLLIALIIGYITLGGGKRYDTA